MNLRGCDIDEDDVAYANRALTERFGEDKAKMRAQSVYDLSAREDAEELIICCEVLEHLERPDEAMRIIADMASQYFIVSVPREPIWCMAQLATLNNIKTLGNTPGHINHWSKRAFRKMVQEYGDIIEERSPLPFNMLLCKAKGK